MEVIVDSQQVQCPNCSARVTAADINIAALIAKCAQCDHVFPLPGVTSGVADLRKTLPAPARPDGIVHEDGPGGELYIRRRWFHPSAFGLLFFCIFWDGFLVFWYAMAFNALFQGKGAFVWVPILFPILHVAVGVGLTYTVVATILNKTQILVDGDTLHIRHRPILWGGNHDLPLAEIRGFELDRKHARNSSATYSIGVQRANGSRVDLLTGLGVDQASYIAFCLAEHLNVPLTDKF